MLLVLPGGLSLFTALLGLDEPANTKLLYIEDERIDDFVWDKTEKAQ